MHQSLHYRAGCFLRGVVSFVARTLNLKVEVLRFGPMLTSRDITTECGSMVGGVVWGGVVCLIIVSYMVDNTSYRCCSA